MRSATRFAALALSLGAALPAAAQGTLADYQRAEGLRARLAGLVENAVDEVGWFPQGDRFWYRKSVQGGSEFVVVDVATGEKRPAFDHQRLAAALGQATRRTYTGVTLPFGAFTIVDAGGGIEVVTDSARWRCTLADYACQKVPARPDAGGGARPPMPGGGLYGAVPAWVERPVASPDGKWEAFVRNRNVAVRSSGAREWTMLSTDGTDADGYALQTLAWSPDSRKIAIYRVKPGFRREIHYVESSPEDQIQPKHSTRLYNKPGDVLDVETPVLFDVAARTQTVVDDALFPNAYDVTPLNWRRDSRAVHFEYNQRGHQVYRIIEVDAATGKARAVVDEQAKTFIDYSGKRFRRDLADGREVIWASERDGWNHLWLYDGLTGRPKHQITKGRWVVRGVDYVDTVAKQIYFRASGMHPGQDPYFVHYYRVDVDGTGLVALTEGDGTHVVSFSPDRSHYVDVWSRVDLPPRAELRRTSDRKVVAELEKADMSALLATGWRAPEPFVAKGRDGVTDIHGVIVRPTSFDPAKRYPVIENIYAGPHSSFVPKSFGLNLGMQAQADVGFIVVQIDGMGTSNRSKAFHDVAWKNIRDAGFPDRIRWHRAVAAKYPYYDTSRVGIYGGSAGGQNAMGALLFHPDFYKVAVSFAGCHDNRMDKIWWNEQWMGTVGAHYDSSSNVVNAHRLRGKLLLLVGEMDENVDPSSTLQVANALIKANKSFDLFIFPGGDHGVGRRGALQPYGDRKQWDYFVRHLLGVEPPDWNAAPVVGAGGTNGAR